MKFQSGAVIRIALLKCKQIEIYCTRRMQGGLRYFPALLIQLH